MNEKELDHFIYCLPTIRQLFGDNSTVGLSNREKYVAYLPGKELVLPIRPGDTLKEGSAAHKVINEGVQVSDAIGKEVFGVAFMALGIPLKDEKGAVFGSLVAGVPLSSQEEITSLAQKMSEEIGVLEASIANIAASSQEFAANIENLSQRSEVIKEKMEVVDTILQLLQEVMNSTHLLGLNAAIEAARAGDLGRGFNVVAEEIRKLSGRTKDSLKQINIELKEVQRSVTEINENIEHIAASSEEQAAACGDVGESTRNLKDHSVLLHQQMLTLSSSNF